MSIGISIVFSSVWSRIEPYLVIERYDRDGGHDNPRIRIGFDGLPESLGREMTFVEMSCVACLRPMHPLRRREGDDFSRLYYGCTCPVTVRMACSKSRSAWLEYERFKSTTFGVRPSPQLSLF